MNGLVEMTRALKFYGFFNIEVDASLDRYQSSHTIALSPHIHIKVTNNSNGENHYSLWFVEKRVPCCILANSNAFQITKQLHAMIR